jgi:hypothetical protein
VKREPEEAHRTALALAGPSAPRPRRGRCVGKSFRSAGDGVVPSREELEQLALELGERERVLRLREEALRRREGRLTDVVVLT